MVMTDISMDVLLTRFLSHVVFVEAPVGIVALFFLPSNAQAEKKNKNIELITLFICLNQTFKNRKKNFIYTFSSTSFFTCKLGGQKKIIINNNNTKKKKKKYFLYINTS
jgi:hypothetical protein